MRSPGPCGQPSSESPGVWDQQRFGAADVALESRRAVGAESPGNARAAITRWVIAAQRRFGVWSALVGCGARGRLVEAVGLVVELGGDLAQLQLVLAAVVGAEEQVGAPGEHHADV